MTGQTGRRLTAAIVLSLLAVPAFAEGETRTPDAVIVPSQVPAIYPVDQLRPGQMGVARTVFEQDRMEEFQVEILGVLKNAIGPKQDMILARLKGEKVEFTGVVAGMSGSPVYIDGKLLGALSYRIGQFSKEPIAGITPIGDMLSLVGTKQAERASARPANLIAWLAGGADPKSFPAGAAVQPVVAGDGMGFRPIAMPLVCAGCAPEALRAYAPAFEAMGFEPTLGGGVDDDPGGPLPEFAPGAAIGATLATGDLNLSAVGTMTYKDGDRVFGFGHPMTGAGTVDVPMTQARVVLTLASQAGSFKIANATAPIGAIVEDRLTAIVGQIGRTAPMMPLTVSVGGPGGTREFHYGLTRDRTWAPIVMGITAASSLLRTAEYQADATLNLKYRLELEGYPTIEQERLFAGVTPAQPVHLQVANEPAGLLGFLYTNPWATPVVKSARIDVEVLPPSRIANLVSLSASRAEVRPGEKFRVDATLAEFRGRERTVSFDVSLPEDTPAGEIQIIVGGGGALDGLDRRIIERQVQQAAGLDDILRLIGRQRTSQAIYLRATRRSPSAIVRSELLPELPLSIFSVYNNPRLNADSTLLMEAPVYEASKDQDVVVVGGRRISVKVK
ncbi:MAG TPA: SpoIVB peptidase S55 domain-containing protein [Candidatus Polarisedimenticolia bacterium]|nr:SpoIVB peptidase S55 domain-containing protein [Candidatus Polarisedimenticolia bacterium]